MCAKKKWEVPCYFPDTDHVHFDCGFNRSFRASSVSMHRIVISEFMCRPLYAINPKAMTITYFVVHLFQQKQKMEQKKMHNEIIPLAV